VHTPDFHATVAETEANVEAVDAWTKNLMKEGTEMIRKGKGYSEKVAEFAQRLSQCPDVWEADNASEPSLAKALGEYGKVLMAVEEQRQRLISNLERNLLKPLEVYRKEESTKSKTKSVGFKKINKEYHEALDKACSMKPTSKHGKMEEADQELVVARRSWISNALSHLQGVSMQMQNRRLTISEKMCEAMKDDLEFAANVANIFDARLKTEHEVQAAWAVTEEKDKRARENAASRAMREAEARAVGIYAKSHGAQAASAATAKNDAKIKIRRGSWLYIQKRTQNFRLTQFSVGGSGWIRTWCSGDGKYFYTPGSEVVTEEGMLVLSCCQQNSDQTDRRFCFEVNGADGVSLICQALSYDHRLLWMTALGSVFTPAKSTRKKHSSGAGGETQASLLEIERGFAFLKTMMHYVEENIIDTHGLYRTGGVKSKVTLLLETAIKKNKQPNLADEESETVTSAIKSFLGSTLHDPVIPEGPRRDVWLRTADMPPGPDRLQAWCDCAEDIGDANRVILAAVIAHLHKVSLLSDVNMMMASNLGVVFGPTVLWSRGGDLLSISACNKVIEKLIEDCPEMAASGLSLLRDDTVPGVVSPLRGSQQFAVVPGHAEPRVSYDEEDTNVDDYDIGGDVPATGAAAAHPSWSVAGPPPAPPSAGSKPALQHSAGGSTGAGVAGGPAPPSAGSKPILQLNPQEPDAQTDSVAFKLQLNTELSSALSQRNSVAESDDGADDNEGTRGGEDVLMDEPAEPVRTNSLGGFDAQAMRTTRSNSLVGFGEDPLAEDEEEATGSSAGAGAAVADDSGDPIPGKQYRALFTCVGGDDEELSFEKGTFIKDVTSVEDEEGWWEGTHSGNGQRGLFPNNYVELIAD
jgi:hypothetical protein